MTPSYKREFIHELRDAIEAAAIPAAYKLLLFILANHAKSDGSNTHPGQGRLAVACGCSERTVRAHLAHLQEAGWLEVTERGCSGEGRGGRRRANVYQLRVGRTFAFAHGAVRFPPNDDKPVEPKVAVKVPARARSAPVPAPAPVVSGFGANLSIDDIMDF